MSHHSPIQNPDGLLMHEPLPPDPLFMALRHALQHNPLARLIARLRGDDEADLATDLAEISDRLPDATVHTSPAPTRESNPQSHDIAA